MSDKKLAAMQQALERLMMYHSNNGFAADAEAIAALEAALAEPIPHGCYVDLVEGVEPDGCVFDEGRPGLCLHARRLHREGKGKESCDYWRPIEVKK